MLVLGIDPGTRLTGYAAVHLEHQRTELAGAPRLHEGGVIRLDTKTSIADRLVELERDVTDVIERTRPETVAVEKLYAHYKHPTTAIVMGHARGVIFLAARRAGLSLVELGATEVKKSLTGRGHASKTQMQHAVMLQLGLAEPPNPPDVADAIAVALCCARRAHLDGFTDGKAARRRSSRAVSGPA